MSDPIVRKSLMPALAALSLVLWACLLVGCDRPQAPTTQKEAETSSKQDPEPASKAKSTKDDPLAQEIQKRMEQIRQGATPLVLMDLPVLETTRFLLLNEPVYQELEQLMTQALPAWCSGVTNATVAPDQVQALVDRLISIGAPGSTSEWTDNRYHFASIREKICTNWCLVSFYGIPEEARPALDAALQSRFQGVEGEILALGGILSPLELERCTRHLKIKGQRLSNDASAWEITWQMESKHPWPNTWDSPKSWRIVPVSAKEQETMDLNKFRSDLESLPAFRDLSLEESMNDWIQHGQVRDAIFDALVQRDRPKALSFLREWAKGNERSMNREAVRLGVRHQFVEMIPYIREMLPRMPTGYTRAIATELTHHPKFAEGSLLLRLVPAAADFLTVRSFLEACRAAGDVPPVRQALTDYLQNSSQTAKEQATITAGEIVKDPAFFTAIWENALREEMPNAAGSLFNGIRKFNPNLAIQWAEQASRQHPDEWSLFTLEGWSSQDWKGRAELITLLSSRWTKANPETRRKLAALLAQTDLIPPAAAWKQFQLALQGQLPEDLHLQTLEAALKRASQWSQMQEFHPWMLSLTQSKSKRVRQLVWPVFLSHCPLEASEAEKAAKDIEDAHLSSWLDPLILNPTPSWCRDLEAGKALALKLYQQAVVSSSPEIREKGYRWAERQLKAGMETYHQELAHAVEKETEGALRSMIHQFLAR